MARTAIIICDMWDTHTCGMSAQRVALMAPRMNQVVSAARSLGVMIIHAPSDTMKFYEGTPWRERMRSAPTAASPFPIIARCPRVPEEERDFPIDDSAGGCDDPIVKPETGPPYPWTRENPAIDIVGFDGVSESGQEIYNFCKQEGIDKIVLMGVHTNICILNRGFGARQMTRLGFDVVLARDLTDSMYDPRTRPVRQSRARHGAGDRAHRDDVVSFDPQRGFDPRRAGLGGSGSSGSCKANAAISSYRPRINADERRSQLLSALICVHQRPAIQTHFRVSR